MGICSSTRSQLSPYRRLYADLYEQISSGQLTGQLPSITMLCETYELNHNTVKKALNQLKEYRFVIARQGKGFFVNPENSVNLLAQKNVTLFLPPIVMQNPFYIRLVFTLRTLLELHRCHVSIINTLSQLKAFAGQIDILLLFELIGEETLPELERRVDRNRIIWCNSHAPEGGRMVGTDNFATGQLAARFLYENGSRNPGILRVSDEGCIYSHFYTRWQGFKDFVKQHPDMKPIESVVPMAEISTSISQKWAARLFQQTDKPDAIFLFMDILVFAVMEQCRKHGLKIPVLGHDDQHFTQQMIPSLSTIREDDETIAKEIVNQIRSIFCGENAIQNILVPARLKLRESTGTREEGCVKINQ